MTQPRVVLLGTDPVDPRGGIGVAMAGFKRVLEEEHLLHAYHRTYRPDVRLRWIRTTVGAIRPMLRSIREIRRRGLEPVVYIHAGGPVSMVRETALLRLARFAGARTMLQLHSVHVADFLEHPSKVRAFRRMVRFVDRICVLTPYWKRLLDASGIGPTFVVPNPLPPEFEEAASQPLPTRAEGPLRVLCMTRLVPGKGVDVAIDAMRFAPEGARLVVAGSGPLRGSLEERARGLPVELAGWVSGERKLQLFTESQVFLLPTQYDATGMGFLEAAAFGMPAVALRWRAIPDMVEHGVSGLLVDDSDPRQLGAALHELADSAFRRKLGVAAKARVLERFSAAAVGQAFRAALPRG